ncbi:MAG: DNA gyrase/topoisomerase IV subunit A [Christensenellales bacterium]|jgi:DNA gyrase subunit A
MARKKQDDIVVNEKIIEKPMEEIVHDSMMPYAEYVIMERALPRVEDGLKPVQRRILYTMNDLGLTPDKPYKKCARVVGECLGKYHPHGDTAVYDALVRMAQPFNMRSALVDGHGNFGSIDGDRAAAIRYTECRMMPLALELLEGIDKNTVDFSLNFDDSVKEPDILPGGFPNLLVNGAYGIAVGLATNIPPHNLGEAIDGVIAQIERPAITTKELLRHVKGPDFPTGGLIVGGDDLEKIYESGRGRVLVRAKVDVEQGSAGRKLLVISEIPYQVNKANLLSSILKLSEKRKADLAGIYDIRDESDRMGMRAVVELRKDADVDRILACLYKYSDLQTTFGVNMVAIAEGKPMQLGIKQVNDYYIRHRREVVTRATRHELEGALARAHVLNGLIIAVENIDEVIRLIRSSKTPKEARELLMIRFALTDVQAQAILDLRLQRLTGLEILNLKNELAELEKRIAYLEGILSSEKKLLSVIKAQLGDIKKRFADPRRTKITEVQPEIEFVPAELEPVPTLVAVMHDGFIKRMAEKVFARREEGDGVVWRKFDIATDWKLLFFTDKGNCFTVNPEQIPECRLKDRGMPFVALLSGLSEGEKVVEIIPVSPEAGGGEYFFFTRLGMVKRTAAAEYGARRGKVAAISLKGDDSLEFVAVFEPGKDVFMVSRKGFAVCAREGEFPATGRTTAGVKGIALDASDGLAFAAFISRKDELVLFTDRGYGKRMLAVDFDRQKRGGKGTRAYSLSRNGAEGSEVAAALALSSKEAAIIVIQKSGEQTRIGASEIMIEARSSKGSPYLMVLMDDSITGIYEVL